MNLSWLNITSNFKMNANNISKPRNPNQNLYSIKQINYSAKEKKGNSVHFHSLFKGGQQEMHYSLKMSSSRKSSCCQEKSADLFFLELIHSRTKRLPYFLVSSLIHCFLYCYPLCPSLYFSLYLLLRFYFLTHLSLQFLLSYLLPFLAILISSYILRLSFDAV